MDKKFEEWAKQVSTLHLPRWEELPDMDLYRDQVITLIERYNESKESATDRRLAHLLIGQI